MKAAGRSSQWGWFHSRGHPTSDYFHALLLEGRRVGFILLFRWVGG